MGWLLTPPPAAARATIMSVVDATGTLAVSFVGLFESELDKARASVKTADGQRDDHRGGHQER
eukprot:scaffold97024_cov26-Tisochrysis_lutea.AAC.4